MAKNSKPTKMIEVSRAGKVQVLPSHQMRMDALEAQVKTMKELKLDGWANVVTGLGVKGRDKKTAGRAYWSGIMTEIAAEEIYAASFLARRIVEILPQDGTREWVEFKGLGDDTEPMESKLEALNAREEFKRACIWSRVYGGAALFMSTGADGEKLATPLDPETEQVKALVLFSRWELDVREMDLDKDISSPNFGRPEFYVLNQRKAMMTSRTNVRIHHSRLIRFDGAELPQRLLVLNNYWHDSILNGMQDSLRDYETSHSSLASVLQEFRMVVHKIAGLADAITQGEEDKIKKRIQLMNAVRSVLGSYVLDDTEEMEIHSDTLTGVKESIEAIKGRLQANGEYPHIVLFNESPSGLGADGDASLESWYNYVGAWQRTYLSKRLDQLLRAISPELGITYDDGAEDRATGELGAGGANPREQRTDAFPPKTGAQPPMAPPVPEGKKAAGLLQRKPAPEKESWDYTWKPLWQESGKEKAEREKIEAETDQMRMDQGALDVVDVMEKRFPELLAGQDVEALREAVAAEKANQEAMEMERFEEAKKEAAKNPPAPAPAPRA